MINGLDVSFFDEPQMLAVIPPLRLIGVGLALRTTVLPSLEERIDEIAADADLDEEPDSHFKKLLGVLDRIETTSVIASLRVAKRRRSFPLSTWHGLHTAWRIAV